LIELIKAHNIAVILSVDRNKSIHDFLRADANGNQSFEVMYKNYNKLLKQGLHKNISIEATYTNYNLEQDISLVDLIKFFKKMFNIRIPYITPVNINESNLPNRIIYFSVSSDGKIVACFMYTSKDELSYGEIGSDPDKVLEKAKEFNDRVNIKDNNKKCTKCFAKKYAQVV